ncbi:MAG: hypothetical protein Kow00104_19590 [Rhodothalassiaceae bacterium]
MLKFAAPSALFALVLLGTAPDARADDGDADKGAKIFRRCQACHSVVEGQHRVGPSLHNVYGRKAGTAEGFTRYSDAMKSSGVVWDEKALDAYLADPKGFIPGNGMAFPGLAKAEDRTDVIAFLKRVSGED